MGRRGPKRDTLREARMCRLYQEGHTLQQIGTVYGLTRERVRQIISKAGMTAKDGGIHRQTLNRQDVKAAEQLARRNASAQLWFGCDYATMLALNGGIKPWAKGERVKTRAYFNQMRSATHRGIEWRMTFPEWCRLWEESGLYDQRGRTADGYVMARIQDFGPYAPWNVYITTLRENVVDYQAELKKRGVECTDGYKRLPERAESLGIAA